MEHGCSSSARSTARKISWLRVTPQRGGPPIQGVDESSGSRMLVVFLAKAEA
jgi:hypothetical protein